MINELDENLDEKLLEFCQNDCSDLFLIILKLKFQILKLKTITKIPKFLLKTYAHVYFKVMDFSLNFRHGSYALTTKIFFENVYWVINVKVHLHHSHVTGEILGYIHDFCNLKVSGNQTPFTCIAYYFFKFDMFFLLKGVKIPVWNTRDINIGGNGLTAINFAKFGTQVKFIDTIKYYLKSLGKLASITDLLKILGIIVKGKGVIPYEKINSIKSMNLQPEDGIFLLKMSFTVH